MTIQKGEIWWASLPDPVGSGPGFRRPVVVVQANVFNRSRIHTVVVAVMTGNRALAAMPGNVSLSSRISRLPHDSVVEVTQLLTLDRTLLTDFVGPIPAEKMAAINQGLRMMLDL